ncbi:MAG: biopolymer transporter ExbD, partial [Planctomycetaceae bacterium]|nr:biopolymer transporter ExbD [Planctomycetaceae bacterium]
DLTLTILAPNKVSLNDQTIGLESLTKALADAKKRYADQGVLIRGDARLAYQDLADVLSACNAAGIRNVRLPVRPRDQSAPPN